LQAAIIACHAQAEKAEATDWPRIAALYAHLAAVAPSSIVELNRAEGPEPGLKIADPLLHEPALKAYHLPPSVRGDLLYKLGRYAEARDAFETAAALAGNRREHDLLRRRAAEGGQCGEVIMITCALPLSGLWHVHNCEQRIDRMSRSVLIPFQLC
jgi:predicted RNA polymerase sigma factor